MERTIQVFAIIGEVTIGTLLGAEKIIRDIYNTYIGSLVADLSTDEIIPEMSPDVEKS